MFRFSKFCISKTIHTYISEDYRSGLTLVANECLSSTIFCRPRYWEASQDSISLRTFDFLHWIYYFQVGMVFCWFIDKYHILDAAFQIIARKKTTKIAKGNSKNSEFIYIINFRTRINIWVNGYKKISIESHDPKF